MLTQLGQGLLPEGIHQLANSISPWLSVTFGVGYLAQARGTAVFAGWLTLVMALVGYYGMVFLRYGYTAGTGALLLWALGAVLGGLVFGAGGWYLRNGSQRERALATGLLTAVWIAEGAYLLFILPNAAIGAGFILVGLTVPLVIGRSARERAWSYVAAAPFLALGVVGYVAFTLLSGSVSSL